MSCHGGRSNRLDDQFAEPGFPNIDYYVMGPPVRVGRGGGRGPNTPAALRRPPRCPPLPSSPLRIRQPRLPGTSAGGGRCSIPGPAVEIMLLPLSARAGPSLSSSGNDSTPAKQLPRFMGRATAFRHRPSIPEPAATPNNEMTKCQPNKPSPHLPTPPPHRDLPEAAPARASCSTSSPSAVPPWAD